MRILGIDPSTTSTGVAVIDGYPEAITAAAHRIESAPPKRPRGDKTPPSVAERAARLTAIADHVLALRGRHTVLALIEGPSYASAGAGTWDRAGLWWQIVTRFHNLDVPVVLVPPTTRAKWATGTGAAGKSPIAVHLSRMWPAVDPGITDDEWDALALASMGAQHLEWLPVELARHREQLAKVTWPDVLAGVAA